ncbi:MAG TPA: hypothetical protein PKK67_11180 [Cyclobacteriaceae bacterium]|nr:hypothetical protein [Cyclobacteriaceae bacterium]
MALNPTNFQTYFNDGTTGKYRDGQGVGAITPARHRTLVTEIKESYNNVLESLMFAIDVSVSGAINLRNQNRPLVFFADEILSSDFEFTITNDTYKPSFTLIFGTYGNPDIEFPASQWVMPSGDPRWDNSTRKWTPIEDGLYKLKADYIGPISGNYYWLAEISKSSYT